MALATKNEFLSIINRLRIEPYFWKTTDFRCRSFVQVSKRTLVQYWFLQSWGLVLFLDMRDCLRISYQPDANNGLGN